MYPALWSNVALHPPKWTNFDSSRAFLAYCSAQCIYGPIFSSLEYPGTHQPPLHTHPCASQVKGCTNELPTDKVYHRRYKICVYHATIPEMRVHGRSMRFCQQCGRFQIITEFDGLKKSCRKKLNQHNEQRKKARARRNGLMNELSLGATTTTTTTSSNGDEEAPTLTGVHVQTRNPSNIAAAGPQISAARELSCEMFPPAMVEDITTRGSEGSRAYHGSARQEQQYHTYNNTNNRTLNNNQAPAYDPQDPLAGLQEALGARPTMGYGEGITVTPIDPLEGADIEFLLNGLEEYYARGMPQSDQEIPPGSATVLTTTTSTTGGTTITNFPMYPQQRQQQQYQQQQQQFSLPSAATTAEDSMRMPPPPPHTSGPSMLLQRSQPAHPGSTSTAHHHQQQQQMNTTQSTVRFPDSWSLTPPPPPSPPPPTANPLLSPPLQSQQQQVQQPLPQVSDEVIAAASYKLFKVMPAQLPQVVYESLVSTLQSDMMQGVILGDAPPPNSSAGANANSPHLPPFF